MKTPPIVTPEAWEAARQALLVKEKELTRARDAMAAAYEFTPEGVRRDHVAAGTAGGEYEMASDRHFLAPWAPHVTT